MFRLTTNQLQRLQVKETIPCTCQINQDFKSVQCYRLVNTVLVACTVNTLREAIWQHATTALTMHAPLDPVILFYTFPIISINTLRLKASTLSSKLRTKKTWPMQQTESRLNLSYNNNR